VFLRDKDPLIRTGGDIFIVVARTSQASEPRELHSISTYANIKMVTLHLTLRTELPLFHKYGTKNCTNSSLIQSKVMYGKINKDLFIFQRKILSSVARMLRSQVRILLGAWMYVCVSLCCVVLCVGRGLASSRSPVQGVLPFVYRFTSKNPSTPEGKRGRLRKKAFRCHGCQ
jgi:hypothetical protein